MKANRVVRLRTPATGANGRYTFGSGYLIGRELVLTAAHALRPPGDDEYVPKKGDKCQVLRNDHDPGDGWLDGCVEASSLEVDLAVVSVAGLAEDVTPVRWARLDESVELMDWLSMGFPVAGLDDAGRQLEIQWGRFSPAARASEGRLALPIKSGKPRPRLSGSSGWATEPRK